MDKVTVIVPFYGVEAYIGQCLDSLINQTYHELEILCIDDASLDGTLDIVKSYAATDKRVQIIRHTKNKGLGGARNTGIRAASGDYICFVDSDDFVSPDFVECLYRSIEKTGSDVAVCGFIGFDEDKKQIFKIQYDDEQIDTSNSGDNIFDHAGKIKNSFWIKMYRRAFLQNNNIWQPENRYYEDVAPWLKTIYFSTKISTVSEVAYHYRVRDGSIMNSFSMKHIDDRFYFLKEADNFFKEEILATPGINVYKITHDALNYFIGHLYYGETLIDDFGHENATEYLTCFNSQLLEFSKTHNWPVLPSEYNEHVKEQKLKSNFSKIGIDSPANLDELQSKLITAQNALLNSQKKLSVMQSSHSWRLTRPLRKLRDFLNI